MKDRMRKRMMKDIEQAHKKYIKSNETYLTEMKHIFNQKWNWTSNEIGDKFGEKYSNLIEYMYLYKKVVEKNVQQFTKDGRNVKKLVDSLNGSLGCSYDNKYFEPCIKDLINNDPDSFLMIPIIYRPESPEHDGHSVSLVIQKEDNKIKVRVCNKGGQLVPNERLLVEKTISGEQLDEIAYVQQWRDWDKFSPSEKFEFWASLSEQEKSDCLNYPIELDKLWLDLDARQLRPFYVYVFEESKETIKAISKAIRIGRNMPKWRDMISLYREKDVNLMMIFQEKNFLYYHKRAEYPLKKLYRHAIEGKFENYVASSQLVGGCGVKNIGLAFKYILGYKTKVLIKDKEYAQCKQVKDLDQLLIKAAKEEVNVKSYDDFLDNNYAFFVENKKDFINDTRRLKLLNKELLIRIVQENSKGHTMNQKDVIKNLKIAKWGEEYLLKASAIQEYLSKSSNNEKGKRQSTEWER